MSRTDDPDAYLRAFHDQRPGQSPRHFARGVTEEGGSSYEAIARRVGDARCVLDLGCGDGFLLERIAATAPSCELIGVDMSAGELERARGRSALVGAELIEARAQALPLESGHCDLVVSHMAFMLMSEMDAVAKEIARVLAPGGRFLTVVGGGPVGEQDGFHLFVSALQRLARGDDEMAPRIGDKRARTQEGVRELFSEAIGFGPIEMTELTLRTDGPAEIVFGSLMQMYGPELLSPSNQQTLRAEFTRAVEPLMSESRTVPCTEWIRVFTITRK